MRKLSIADADVLSRSFGSKKADYTLGQWLAAQGITRITCLKDGTSNVKMEFLNLVPNGGLYSMWAFWAVNGQNVVIPFGGSGTNSFATARKGTAKLSLSLPYCALDPQTSTMGTAKLVAVQLDFHSDDGITGSFPNLPQVPLRGPGIIGHSQFILPLQGVPCEEVGDCVLKP